jgi:hypothetical protein
VREEVCLIKIVFGLMAVAITKLNPAVGGVCESNPLPDKKIGIFGSQFHEGSVTSPAIWIESVLPIDAAMTLSPKILVACAKVELSP